MVSFHTYVMAVDRVERLLRMVTAALDGAGVPYAVVGGNAVAAWVARADPSATRSTKDVDVLVRRDTLARIDAAMSSVGLQRIDLRRIVLYVDPAEPSKRSGVHLVWAEELLRPSYTCPSPRVDESVIDPQGFKVLDLPALVRMKLTSFRDVDRVHVADLVGQLGSEPIDQVGLIDARVRSALPADLARRLTQIESSRDDGDELEGDAASPRP